MRELADALARLLESTDGTRPDRPLLLSLQARVSAAVHRLPQEPNSKSDPRRRGRYGIKDAELLEHSPVSNVRRPKVSEDSVTVGLTAEELDRLLTSTEAHGPRSAVLVTLLVNGPRIAEVPPGADDQRLTIVLDNR